MPIFSFIIPAYNEQDNIKTVYSKILELIQKNEYNDYEIIFVDDGSIDNTSTILKELAKNNQRVKFIELSRNFGHQAALWSGMAHATGEAIISLDCDLQDPPEVISEMITKWKQGHEIVYARRLNFRTDNFLKKILSKFYYRLLDKMTSIDIPQNVGDFRLIDKKVLKALLRMNERSKYLRGMVAWTGFNSTYVNYKRPDRQKGVSNYTFAKLLKLAVSGMMNFSSLPLKLGLILGIISIISGLVLLTYQIFDAIINNAYYHLYKWLVVIIFIFIGFLFMLMWIIGEYIGKVYDEVRDRPVFVIKDKYNFDTQ